MLKGEENRCDGCSSAQKVFTSTLWLLWIWRFASWKRYMMQPRVLFVHCPLDAFRFRLSYFITLCWQEQHICFMHTGDLSSCQSPPHPPPGDSSLTDWFRCNFPWEWHCVNDTVPYLPLYPSRTLSLSLPTCSLGHDSLLTDEGHRLY